MLFHEVMFTQPDKLNACLYGRFRELCAAGQVRQTHHFAGRFENIYIEATAIPQIARVLTVAKQQAGALLDIPADRLKAGFWFNAMEAGHRTSLHHHEENDELLSGVYYIRVPENSGDLILHDAGNQIRIQPQEGKLVMFAPGVLHEVTANTGTELRLSVGINVGPADDGSRGV
ncbi:MAG: 2OG-Fe(II) oxygenase family protein [Gammaproteobacteria bacterium]|nr:2OG-Fe(II) oxygenase family protein [Gammaproteobacteria bacterium]